MYVPTKLLYSIHHFIDCTALVFKKNYTLLLAVTSGVAVCPVVTNVTWAFHWWQYQSHKQLFRTLASDVIVCTPTQWKCQLFLHHIASNFQPLLSIFQKTTYAKKHAHVARTVHNNIPNCASAQIVQNLIYCLLIDCLNGRLID